MKKTLLIFDMDGVLVEPRRYRAALEGTMDFFGDLMGWDSLYPGEKTIAWFESRGIISEWDIAPLYLAATFEAILTQNPALQIPPDLFSACEIVRTSAISKPDILVETYLDHLHGQIGPGLTVCDLVLQLNKNHKEGSPFKKLAGNPLLLTILNKTRDIHVNLITRVFQEMFLGKDELESTYNLPGISQTQSVSQVIDRELISPEWKQNLFCQWNSGDIEMVIYTARPSSPKYCKADGKLQYSPEADMVTNQLGWQEVPLIGLGQLKYAADQFGCTPEELIKPSPVHALGAIGSALSRNTLPAIQAGWELMNQKDTSYFDSLSGLEVHVFEDSPTGITGVIQAVDILKKRGISVQLTKWGITTDINKMDRLIQYGSNIKASVNDALDSIHGL